MQTQDYRNVSDERMNSALLRIVPLMCCQKNSFFDLSSCRFHLDPSKCGTGRHVVYTRLNVHLSFTLEASFYGYTNKQGHNEHFTVADFENCGQTLLDVINSYIPG